MSDQQAAPATRAPRPWTDDVPEFAAYPVKYFLQRAGGVPGHLAWTSSETYDAAFEAQVADYAERQGPVEVLAVHLAPDGRPVLMPNWAGGTWGGKCGSSAWVIDADGIVRAQQGLISALGGSSYVQHERGVEDTVTRTQAWWINGIRSEADGWDDFRVACAQAFRHEGLCQAAETWAWDAKARVALHHLPGR